MKLAIGLGASLGDRRARLELTVRQLAATPGLRFLRGSRWYRSPPLRGGSAQNWFLNGVALYECELSVETVLARCQALEAAAGRRRARYWGDRPLDLDLLVAEGITSHDPVLTLPHPAIAARPFVLTPLLEVWPDVENTLKKTRFADEPAPPGPRPWGIGMVAKGASAA